jgi:hypothetical protein
MTNGAHDYREELKSDAVAAIEKALSTIEQSREPDLWERVFLVEAISSIFRGAYQLAGVNVAIAMTPPQDRLDLPELPSDPIYDRCTVGLIRKALDEAKAEPARLFSHFGPIVLTRRPAPDRMPCVRQRVVLDTLDHS